MKHLYSMLATGVLMASSALTATADRYWTYDMDSPLSADAVKTDQWYCLQGGQSIYDGSYITFLAGEFHSNSINLTTDNLYKFVPAGTNDNGDPVYYVQRYDGTYLYAPGQTHFYGDAIDRAWKLSIKEAEVYESDYEYTYTNPETDEETDYTGMSAYIAEARDNGDFIDLTAATYCDVANGLVLASSTPSASTDWSVYVYLCGLGAGSMTGYPSRATNYSTNVWVIYPAEVQGAYDSLLAIMNEISNTDPEGLDLSAYNIGTGAGEYDEDLYNAFMALWTRALEIYQAGGAGATDEEMDEIASKLKSTLEAFRNSGKGLEEGYYILYNCRASGYSDTSWPWVSNSTNYDGGAMYDGGVVTTGDNGLRWSLKKDDGVDIYISTDENQHAVVTDADGNVCDEDGVPYIRSYNTAKFVWHAFKSGNKDNQGNDLFYFQNLESGRYIGYVDAFLKPIQMTDEPEGDYTIASNPYIPGWFCFYSPKLPTGASDAGAPSPGEYSGIHTERAKDEVVAWDWRIAGSCWKVVTLTDEDLAVLRDNMEAPQRLNNLAKLVLQAETAIEKGYSYLALDAEGKVCPEAKSGSLALDGLVQDIDQLNCPMIETSEGSLDALLDSDKDSYFHSTWSGFWAGDHFLEIQLPETENELWFKWVKRASNNNGAPLKITVWGSNDESDLDLLDAEAADGSTDYNAWQQTWKNLGTGTFEYPYADAQKNLANTVGLCRIQLAEPAKYLRMAVNSRVSNTDVPNSNYYFHGAEFRLYRSKYDAETSLINAVPADVLAALKAAIEKAKEEIADGVATEATIAELQAAYDAFMEHYPDPIRITNVLTEAKALAKTAQEGDGLGYYAKGSVAKLEAAIAAAEAQVKDVMTVEEINSVLAALNAALDEFRAALQVPTDGIYVIKSKSVSSTVQGCAICASSSSEKDNVSVTGTVKTDKKDIDGNVIYEDEGNANLRAGIYWYVTKVDGGYTYKNLYTGKYLHPVSNTSEVLALSAEPYTFGIQFAKEPGCFNLVLDKADAKSGTYIYANAQPGTRQLCTWYAAEGRDNSAFEFIPQDEAAINNALDDNGLLFDVKYPGAPQAYTFTIIMDNYVDNDAGAFYDVIGQDANNNIQLKAVEVGYLAAGQAYIYVPANYDEKALFFLRENTDFTTLEPIWEPKEKNGLCGTFETIEIAAGSGIFNALHSMILTSEEGETVAANTGYFAKMPETTETGDVTIPANGKITAGSAEGINTISFIDNRVENGIYTLSGLRLTSVKNLPAGLYIINGKKYMVK